MSKRRCHFNLFLPLAIGWLVSSSVLADGCFVFKWNKAIDINEPTQKAIIVHDAGRQDLLLQVRYEGPLEEFGWLIPVPSLPKVEKGSMEAFYELSKLTQRQFGDRYNVATLGGRGGREETVKVIEIKTVGAYEVAVLSAQDSGSLAHWLRTNDYSIPEGKSEIVDEYVRKGWYFIAAKIQLNKGVAFKTVSSASPKDPDASGKARNTLRTQLANGELHPLLVSFDTPKCIFPLKISAVGGKPSEVSLYVLSGEPLLNKLIFDERFKKYHQHAEEWRRERERMRPQSDKAREISMQNMRSLRLAVLMNSLSPRGTNVGKPARDWTVEDLVALGKEGQPPMSQEPLDDDFPDSPLDLVQCMRVTPDKLPQSAKIMPQLKGKEWYLTKQVRTFRPEEMRDLEFEPAISILAGVLTGPDGAVAARYLAQLGTGAVPVLVAACKSANATERVNGSAGIGWPKDTRYVEPLLHLLKDENPKVRFNALGRASLNWDPRFIQPLISLLRDPHLQIRMQAALCLRQNDRGERSQVYLDLLKDPDADVQFCALQVLSRTNGTAIPRDDLLRLLGSPRIQTISLALSLLDPGQASLWSGQPPVQDPFGKPRAEKSSLASLEAAPLMTNHITLARLMGLRIMHQNADAEAIELTLPLLGDTNSIVRNRAVTLLRSVSGQDMVENDQIKWQQWWAANKATFTPYRSQR